MQSQIVSRVKRLRPHYQSQSSTIGRRHTYTCQNDAPAEELAALRRHERTSRPLGSEAFVEKVGVLIGGDLRQKKPGRKVRSRGTSVGGHNTDCCYESIAFAVSFFQIRRRLVHQIQAVARAVLVIPFHLIESRLRCQAVQGVAAKQTEIARVQNVLFTRSVKMALHYIGILSPDQCRPTRHERSPRPPQMQRRNMPLPDGFLPARFRRNLLNG